MARPRARGRSSLLGPAWAASKPLSCEAGALQSPPPRFGASSSGRVVVDRASAEPRNPPPSSGEASKRGQGPPQPEPPAGARPTLAPGSMAAAGSSRARERGVWPARASRLPRGGCRPARRFVFVGQQRGAPHRHGLLPAPPRPCRPSLCARLPLAAPADFSPALEKRVSRGSHTIVLVQLLPEITSRTYHDFERLDEALDGEPAVSLDRRGTWPAARRPRPIRSSAVPT